MSFHVAQIERHAGEPNKVHGEERTKEHHPEKMNQPRSSERKRQCDHRIDRDFEWPQRTIA